MIKIIFLFLILNLMIFSKNEVTLNYKENEPLLGKGFYLTFGEIPIGTYENTTGYFSTVEILGKNLEIKDKLQKIIIKVKDDILKKEDVEWVGEDLEIKDIDLKGLVLSLKWNNLKKDQIGVMIEKWNLEKGKYELEIEYHYPKNVETIKLCINMPKLNPEIYLDVNNNSPILKKQEYDKNSLILKKIKLHDYDTKITEGLESLDGLRVKLNSELSIGNKEYLGLVKLTPLIEKYPGIYLEENNLENIFENSKEIVIGVQLPEDLNFNSSYKIFGNLLELNYGNNKQEMLEKTIILDGKNKIKRVVAFNNIENNEKIYLDDNEKNFIILEREGKMIGKYKNLKIKANDEEIIINENGDSESVSTFLGKLQVEQGKIVLILNEKELKQGSELKFKVLNFKNEILEEITLQIYLKLY